MHLLITGGCGFVGSCLAKFFLSQITGSSNGTPRKNLALGSAATNSHPSPLNPFRVTLVDNLMRPGSQINPKRLECLGARVLIGDLRDRDWVQTLPPCDWVIDCAANPSVLAGTQDQPSGPSSSQQLIDHNLGGTVHLLEYCKRHRAGMVLVSTSRVYSIAQLAGIPHRIDDSRLVINWEQIESKPLPNGLSRLGIREDFSIEPPLSLYGTTKLASEWLAKEYASAFGFPIWINRCGILAGAGQFGKADQGIIAYWMHRFLYRHPLRFIGFQGTGAQVRDCLHPEDLARLILTQIQTPKTDQPTTVNVSGGVDSAFSLLELHEWCVRRWGAKRFGAPPTLQSVPAQRPFDAPWIVLDSSLAKSTWNWSPQKDRLAIWEEIAEHAEENPDWLQMSQGID